MGSFIYPLCAVSDLNRHLRDTPGTALNWQFLRHLLSVLGTFLLTVEFGIRAGVDTTWLPGTAFMGLEVNIIQCIASSLCFR